MEKRDFIYHFTDILFAEIVNETILIENWKETDFDYRYAEYINIFQRMLDTWTKGSPSDEILFTRLGDSRKKMVNLFNEKMKAHFIKELTRYGIWKGI